MQKQILKFGYQTHAVMVKIYGKKGHISLTPMSMFLAPANIFYAVLEPKILL